MTKSVFHLQYDKKIKISLSAVLVVFFLLAVREILCIAQIWLKPYNLILDISSLSISALVVFFVSFMLFGSRYVVKKNSLYIRMGVFVQRIPCGLMSCVTKINKNGYFLFYTSLDAKPSQLKINVTDEDFENLFNALKSLNHLIVYEIINEEQK